jgi:hypothetical protein
MPPSMDVFEGSAFNTRALTAAVNDMAYVPGQVSSLGLFDEAGVAVTRVMVERQAGTVALVPVTPRGGPGVGNNIDRRNMVSLEIPHLQLDDAVVADEVQGVREFGSESSLRTVQSLVNQKQARMVRNLDLTMEYHRLGALKGQVLDADGVTVLFDYFTAFGEAAPAVIDFDLDNAAPASGALRTKCSQAIRVIAVALGGVPYQRIHGLAGSTFIDQLVAHPEYRETHIQQEATVLRAGVPYRQFEFGGITFEEYRGPSSGPAFIAAGDVRLFPVGVPDLFITRFAPADYEDTVNTIGIPRYSDQRPDPSAPRKRRVLEVQTNPIHICTRPRVLQRGTNT